MIAAKGGALSPITSSGIFIAAALHIYFKYPVKKYAYMTFTVFHIKRRGACSIF